MKAASLLAMPDKVEYLDQQSLPAAFPMKIKLFIIRRKDAKNANVYFPLDGALCNKMNLGLL